LCATFKTVSGEVDVFGGEHCGGVYANGDQLKPHLSLFLEAAESAQGWYFQPSSWMPDDAQTN